MNIFVLDLNHRKCVEYDIENWLQEESDLVYRKMNFFHHNFLHNKNHILTFLKYSLIFIAGFIFGKLI